MIIPQMPDQKCWHVKASLCVEVWVANTFGQGVPVNGNDAWIKCVIQKLSAITK